MLALASIQVIFICFDIETSKLTLQDGSNFQMMYLGCVKIYDGKESMIENGKYKEMDNYSAICGWIR